MSQRIYIAVACWNRKRIAGPCLPTLKGAAGPDDRIHLFNDGSTEYDTPWLEQFGDKVFGSTRMGIEAQRRMHLAAFWHSEFEYLYFTDHDAIHDPDAMDFGIHLSLKYGGPLVCLYNTMAHVRLAGNTTGDCDGSQVIWRRYAPGISYLLTREHVKELIPKLSSITNFDWNIPDILGNHCAVSRVSYCDHIGFGGDRHPKDEGVDGGDVALNPTDWLVIKRAQIITKLKADAVVDQNPQ